MENQSHPSPPANAETALQHGVATEINAVGKLVGKVLPVYLPETFFEEGCYSIAANDENSFRVISPDGSLRKENSPIMAVELKCPVPGKKYVPDVITKFSIIIWHNFLLKWLQCHVSH